MHKNVFVLGLDELNRANLRTLRDAPRYRFHQLLTIDELQHGDTIPLPDLLDKARRQLDAFDGTVDAIVGYWDFPVSLMVPILCEERGMPSAQLTSVVKCEHKYWSRLEQQKVIDEHPRFGLIDLDGDDPGLPDGLSYPVWVKPVKSAASEGAYRCANDGELRRKLAKVREEAGRMGEPFAFVLSLVELPPEIAAVGGTACLVEEASRGQQITAEGYVHDGDVTVYGVVDSVHYPGTTSFLRYEYPSRLPDQVTKRIADVTRRVIGAVGLDRSTFNIEYFWDADSSRLELLEINPRHSQSHARLFQLVDGLPNHQFMIDLAMGADPEVRAGEGPYDVAAKWFVRWFADGVVRAVPSPSEIAQLEQDVPGSTIAVTVEEGDRLSDLHGEDSYSFVLAHLYIGAANEDDLVDKFEKCAGGLHFEIEEHPARGG
ncbi:ATP-grasp domain-containing protein [Jiangella asiatica]|uniref:ATP-grasp domain-containing protein n=1 Tax=Jiangella asiatica TaxID=2530372 RepID=A0A4R5DPQ7_9ACTN|nr:ATP-grasp domain-containing protein [Jiangella asiatica]TDE14031.1 ATP-grasp domain-containing protein [Jiangella asiatica]